MPSNTIGLIIHPTKDTSASTAIIRAIARARRVRIIGLHDDRDRLPDDVRTVNPDEFVARATLVIALGGDGTMLGAMRLVARHATPVLGVNYGNLGFLVEVQPEDLESALARVLDGDYSIEPHHALGITLSEGSGVRDFLSFNDLSISRRPGNSAVQADLTVNDIGYGYYKADTLVISSPAGSTAYNYAAGGPILSPGVEATIITPVAPMSGIDRSLVLSAEETVTLTVTGSTAHAAIEIDGRLLAEANAGLVITVELRRHAGNVVRLDAQAHSQRGRLKLSLLDLPLHRDQIYALLPDSGDIPQRFLR